MDYRQLNRTDLKVSRICFGTMTFGRPVDQPTANRMIDRCIEAGINFIDTANAYQHGGSEAMLGEALRGKRKNIILSTKVHHQMGDGPDMGGLSRAAIARAVEDSLKRLQTDYIDVYYLHQPDHDVPIEESLEAMNALVRQGKIRYIGLSNYAAWQVCEMHWISEKNGYQAPMITQPMCSLVARGIEQEFLPMAKRFGLSTVVYNPLAGGLLSGKHDPNKVTPGGRFDPAFWGQKLYQDRYWHPQDGLCLPWPSTGCCIIPPPMSCCLARPAWSNSRRTWGCAPKARCRPRP
jgi:aryl-alcohol dehydrogenase-like predicted oxidoreductase